MNKCEKKEMHRGAYRLKTDVRLINLLNSDSKKCLKNMTPRSLEIETLILRNCSF